MLLSNKQNGFSIPIVLIFVLAFLAAPLFFWFASYKLFQQPFVKGVSSQEKQLNGLNAEIISEKGSWNLERYLCKTKTECTEDAESGKKADSMSGGATKQNIVQVKYSDAWKDYKFMKMVVKPGWGSSSHNFTLKTDLSGTEFEKLDLNDGAVSVVFPLSIVEQNQNMLVVFSDVN